MRAIDLAFRTGDRYVRNRLMDASEIGARKQRFAATLPRTDRPGPVQSWRGYAVQTARPRDVGALVFVVGLFVVLTLITVLVPAH